MRIKFKSSVMMPFVDTELLRGLIYFAEVVDEAVPYSEITVTSLVDGIHMKGSLHYEGKAADIRSHTYSKTLILQIIDRFKEMYDAEYDLIWEYPGTANEHFHLEYDPK